MRFSLGLDGLPGVINRCTYTRLALRDELHPDPHTPTPHARSGINGPNYRCVPYHGGFFYGRRRLVSRVLRRSLLISSSIQVHASSDSRRGLSLEIWAHHRALRLTSRIRTTWSKPADCRHTYLLGT